MRRDDLLSVFKAGLSVSITDIETNEIYAIVPLDVGLTSGAKILPYITEGTKAVFDKGVTLIQVPRRIGRLRSPEAFESSANPDFRPSAMQQQALEMENMLRTTRAAMAREVAQAAASIRRMQQQAPQAAPVVSAPVEPVVEPINEPAKS